MFVTPHDFNNEPAQKHLAAGIKLLELRRFEEGIKELSQYLQARPEDPAGHYHLSRAYYGLAKYDEAIACAEQSLSIDPFKGQPLHIIGLAHYKKGEWKETETFLKRAIELEPKNTEYWLSLAVPYLHRAEWNKVESCVEEVMKVNPQHPVAFNYKAQLAMQKGDFAKAKEYIGVALNTEPERSMHHAVAGQIEGMAGNAGHAQLHFDTAINKDPAQVGHRLRYLNTRFSGSFWGQFYLQSSIWGAAKFNGYYLILLAYIPIYSAFYNTLQADMGIIMCRIFFAPILLLFAVYTAIPTLYKAYLNEKNWGGEGVDMREDLWNCAGLTIGLLLSATGIFLANEDVTLLGALWLLFMGGINWVRFFKSKFVRIVLTIL
ncbi:MAG: tetratricopeptide repeat protein, partial [Saprospiraceae bacterium]|nr:tetratricopeptide repeat protein [Saprospiraceae bacterium]